MIAAQARAEKYLKNNHIHKERKVSSRQASKYLVQQELLPTVCYTVDPQPIKNHLDKMVLAVGEYAQNRDTFLYQITLQLSKTLGVPFVAVPGHHGSFMDDAENWASAIDRIVKERFKS